MQLPSSNNELSIFFEELPGWDSMTAYDRAYRCCEELTRRGEDLPSWIGIRQLIGKGSGQDINRAKTEFRKQQVEAVRQMRGIVKGVPETLAPLLMTLWTAAIKEASLEFEKKLITITQDKQEAFATAQQKEYERNEAVNQLHQVEAELIVVKTDLKKIQDDYGIESKLRKVAENRCNELQDLLTEQSEHFRKAIEQANFELKAAISRLEGAEKHTLLEIERVKQEEKLKLDQADSRWQKKHSDQVVIQARLEQTIKTLETNLVTFTQQSESLRIENNYLHEKIKQAEAQIVIFQKNNSILLASLEHIAEKNKEKRIKDDKKTKPIK